MTDNPNLHPIWYRHFGIEPKAAAQQPTTPKADIDSAVAKMANAPARSKVIHDNDGWEPTCAYRPHPGAPVGVRKQLGPHTWISTTVLPGDARYPIEFLAPSATGESA